MKPSSTPSSHQPTATEGGSAHAPPPRPPLRPRLAQAFLAVVVFDFLVTAATGVARSAGEPCTPPPLTLDTPAVVEPECPQPAMDGPTRHAEVRP